VVGGDDERQPTLGVGMSLDAEQLFSLLPAVYRTRDAESGGQLQALFGVIAAQSEIVQDSIQQLYDDQFIETCAPWVIPYIGDLVGYNSLYEVTTGSDSRAEVANTIRYRQRKGTLVALEQMCADVSGRGVLAVEEFRRLIATESLRHVERHHRATVDLREGRALSRIGTPFDVENHTIDVRRIAARVRSAAAPDPAPVDIALHGPGRFNIPDVAIHVWRWQQSWRITGAPAFVLGGGRYMLSPLGADMPLFTNPPARDEFSPTTSADLPRPIGRDELQEFYGSAIQLIADGQPVDAGLISCANLADRPGGSWCTVAPGKIAIDSELGRIRYAADLPQPQSLAVSYSYGFPAPIGGGPYDRTAALAVLEPETAPFTALVGSAEYPTLQDAVAEWNARGPGASGTIVVPGFDTLTIDLPSAVRLPAGSNLAIVAGAPDPGGAPEAMVWHSARPTLNGDIHVTGVPGSGQSADAQRGQLVLSGLWIAGQLVVTGAATTIQLADCTLVPGLGLFTDGEPMFGGEPSIIVSALGTTLVVNRVVCGPIAADASGSTRICASIIDGTSPSHVAYAGPDMASAGADLHVEGSTVVGKVRTRTMTLASNTIFDARLACRDPWPAAIWASRRQTGCVRFCVLPFDSITPGRYECLPPDATSGSALAPSFVTLRYGDPAYGLLSGDCPMAIWNGADNGSQIGAYLQVQETEAVTNVALRAPEYLPALLESGIFIHPSHPHRRPLRPALLYGYGRPQPEGEGPGLPGIGAGLI
jgi:hypothetical protein